MGEIFRPSHKGEAENRKRGATRRPGKKRESTIKQKIEGRKGKLTSAPREIEKNSVEGGLDIVSPSAWVSDFVRLAEKRNRNKVRNQPVEKGRNA